MMPSPSFVRLPGYDQRRQGSDALASSFRSPTLIVNRAKPCLAKAIRRLVRSFSGGRPASVTFSPRLSGGLSSPDNDGDSEQPAIAMKRRVVEPGNMASRMRILNRQGSVHRISLRTYQSLLRRYDSCESLLQTQALFDVPKACKTQF